MDIIVNGQSYSSWDQVPEDIRQQVAKAGLPDADGNGVPDLFEGKGGLPTSGTTTASTISVDGQTFGSLDQLPPEVRQQVQASLSGVLGALGGTATTPAASVPSAPSGQAPGTPAPGQVVLNGETVSASTAAEPEKKGFLKRLFGG